MVSGLISSKSEPYIFPVTESALAPWVSVDASGTPIATITPVLATISGIPTTISAAPVSLTAATTTQQGDSKPTTTSGEAPTSTGGGAFIECNNPDGEFAPFCEPGNGSSVYVGETYYGMHFIDTFIITDPSSDLGYEIFPREQHVSQNRGQLRERDWWGPPGIRISNYTKLLWLHFLDNRQNVVERGIIQQRYSEHGTFDSKSYRA